jgi:hypothetical protein
MPETVVTIKLTPRKWRVIVECLKFSKAMLDAIDKNKGKKDIDFSEQGKIFIQRMMSSDPNNLGGVLEMSRAIQYVLRDLDAE